MDQMDQSKEPKWTTFKLSIITIFAADFQK